MSEHIYQFACRFIRFVGLLLAGLFLIGAFLVTYYCTDMGNQKALFRFDNPLLNLLGLGLLLALAFFIGKFFQTRRLSWLRALVLLWCLAFGAILIVFGKTAPTSDLYSVYSIAESFSYGDMSAIEPTQSYLSYYPQQVGLIAFYEILFRLLHLFPLGQHAYHFFKCLYVLFALGIILVQEELVHQVFQSNEARSIYLLLAGLNLPFLMYTSYLYGEIPSFFTLSLGLLFLIRRRGRRDTSALPKKQRIVFSILGVLFVTLSVLLRKNNLIFVIALLIVLIFLMIREKRISLLIMSLAVALCSFSILPLTQNYYEHRAGNKLSSGVTATSYLAMGMQESTRADGWYNGFNFNTYQESGLNTEKANEISRAAIEERLSYFRAHPGYAVSFYLEKIFSQWADGTYASRESTASTFGGRSDFFCSFYEGSISTFVIEYANFYQLLLYLGFFLYCLQAFRQKENRLELSIGIIWIFGGFLFHIFWEANARYILAYSLMMMPYAAGGLATLYGHFLAWWQKRTISTKNEHDMDKTSNQA